MSYRIIVISNPSYLNIENIQLKINQNNNSYSVPLEDIACIILNSYQITLSANVLSSCAKNNIAVIACDEKHIPNGIFYSYLPHSRQNLVLQTQIKLTKPFKKRLWQIIIQNKIKNQASVLMHINNKESSNKLIILANKVSSGDKENREAQASRIYFKSIFGNSFIRSNDINSPIVLNNKINGLLNYGYTIIRSLIIRGIVGFGLLPTLGIFHNNQLNPFNLADDLIEPFRAYIDWYIYNMIKTSNESKIHLIDCLNYSIIINNKNTSILNATDIMVKSFISSINSNNYNLLLLPNIPNKILRTNLE